jgi:hypothetical protein
MLNRPAPLADAPIPLLHRGDWQMSFGERAAIEGVLSQLAPSLSIELGTADGGSLTSIAEHSSEVHSFDLREPGLLADRFPQVRFHTGDSHELLPRLLSQLARENRNVDFVLVDGDHSPEGAQRDLEDLLASPAVDETMIVLHDTGNPRVRSGFERVDFEAVSKVAHVDLDFVAGYLLSAPGLDDELWGGLGLVWVSAGHEAARPGALRQDRYYPTAQILQQGFDAWPGRPRG